jgi:CheY-like chemotaxis protein
VDDNRDTADSLAVLLQGNVVEVRTAYDGASALALAEEFKPHLALLDLGMPIINGFLLARRFRECGSLKATKLVAVTGYVDAACRNLAADVGFDDFLVKPCSKRSIDALLVQLSNPLPGSANSCDRAPHFDQEGAERRGPAIGACDDSPAPSPIE